MSARENPSIYPLIGRTGQAERSKAKPPGPGLPRPGVSSVRRNKPAAVIAQGLASGAQSSRLPPIA